MAYRSEKSSDTTYATGGEARAGHTKYTKVVSDKHLQDPSEAPNQFTDYDTDDAPKGRGKWQDQQNYGKGS